MRLIDADKFKKYVSEAYEQNKDLFQTDEYRNLAGAVTQGILKDIDEQPTAYDIDKVVEELEVHAIEFEVFGQCSDYVELSHTIEIVKKGSVE